MKKIITLLVLVLCITTNAQVITTICGSGNTYGYSGDNGLAINAQTNYMGGVALDTSGNLFFVDIGNYCVRKIDTNGIITTIAGTGIQGYSGDGGLAINARLNSPKCISVDSAGNIYVGDEAGNGYIRKIDAITGIITRVVGDTSSDVYASVGTTALNTIFGGAFENLTFHKGYMYLVHSSDQLFKVDNMGNLSLVAGSGEPTFGNGCQNAILMDGSVDTLARFSYLHSVSFDNNDNIYLADAADLRVRKVDATTHIVSTYAGRCYSDAGGVVNGCSKDSAEFSLNVYQALNDENGNMYVSDQIGVYKIDTSGIVTYLAGGGYGGYGSFNGPALILAGIDAEYMSIDKHHNIYTSGGSSNLIRKITLCTSPSLPTVSVISINNTICVGDTVTLVASGTNHYAWSPWLPSITDTLKAHPLTTTQYTVYGYDNNSCVATAMTNVIVNPSPNVSFTLTADTIPHIWDVAPIVNNGVAPYSYLWSWGDGTSDNATSHTYQSAANYHICLQVTDANGCLNSYCENDSLYRTSADNAMIQVNVVNATSGINQVSNTKNQLSVYPNPANNVLYISGIKNQTEIQVYDILGNIVIQNVSTQVDISNLQSGVYFLRVGNAVQKFVKQ